MATQEFPISPAAIAVPVLSILTLVLDIPSFVWHIKNRNLPASCLVFWIILCNLFNLVNALIWPTDDLANWWHGQIWCDIQVKFQIAALFAILGAIGSIIRNLAIALNTDRIVLNASSAQRRRNRIIDCLLNFGIPIYMIVIHYVVQPTRYFIVAISGCDASIDNSWPSLVLINIWAPILCLWDAYYAVLVLVRLRKYRKNFSAILAASNSGLTKSRFLRLLSVALVLMLTILPTQCYAFYLTVAHPLETYSWDAVHGPEWWDILLIPSNGSVEMDRWVKIAAGFVVFFAFGFGREAKAMYRSWCLKVGLGKIFPRLCNDRLLSCSQSGQSARTRLFSSKARDFLARKLSLGRSTATFSSSNPSVVTSPSTLSPPYPKKFLPGLNHLSSTSSPSDEIQGNEKASSSEISSPTSRSGSRSWLSIPSVLFSTRKPDAPITTQPTPSQGPSPGVVTHDWSTASAPPAARGHQSDLEINRHGSPPEYPEASG